MCSKMEPTVTEQRVDDQAPEPVYAAVDLGSNSFHLLLATFRAGKMICLDRRKESVRLAAGLGDDGRLSGEAQVRALQTLERFSQLLRGIPPERVRVVGTNTLRAARKASGFLASAEAALGCRIDIISGFEEARLIYLGVAKDFTPGGQRRLVIDIGGGSTEVVLGDDRPLRLESLYMGCVSHTRRFFDDGRITPKSWRKAVVAAQREVQGLFVNLSSPAWDEVVGSSGTIRSVEAVLVAAGFAGITASGVKWLADTLLACGRVDQVDLPGLSEDRKPVFAGGAAILAGVCAELGITEMHSSEYAIREGIIHDLAGRFHHRDKRRETMELMMQSYHVDTAQAARVGNLAQQFLAEVDGDDNGDRGELLRWAANLHEIGLVISHAKYHKHGAYILANSDMPGFARREQEMLSFLVLNHRRKLKKVPLPYGASYEWAMVLALRLAHLFHRGRRDGALPAMQLVRRSDGYRLDIEAQWLEGHPLTAEDLKAETREWQRLGLSFRVRTT